LSKNGQQHLRRFNFSDNQFKKLIFKSTQVFDIFRKVSKFQIYNTKIISVKILADMSKLQYERLLNSLTVL